MSITHPFDFDPTCGYTRSGLEVIEPPGDAPVDFAEFWRNAYRETMAIESGIDVRQIWSPEPDIEVFELRFESLGRARIGAYLARPRESVGGMVHGHGYGGLARPVLHRRMTVVAPCIRGFNLSASGDFPWQSSQHVLCGIESRDTYILRGSVADLWRAASAMVSLYPDTLGNLVYSGGSFGGGLGALAVPWDERIRASYLNVPTFGHHPLRLQYRSNGSGEAVRNYAQSHPEVAAVLPYFDAATAASHIRVPTVCTPALFDPAVVPPGQFAVNNAIPEQFRTTFVLQAGHWTVPEDDPTKAAAAAETDRIFRITP